MSSWPDPKGPCGEHTKRDERHIHQRVGVCTPIHEWLRLRSRENGGVHEGYSRRWHGGLPQGGWDSAITTTIRELQRKLQEIEISRVEFFSTKRKRH